VDLRHRRRGVWKEKEVVSSFGKIVTKLTISSGEKVSYSTISKPNLLQGGVLAMKTRNVFIPFLLVLMLMATFVYAAESTGEYVDDSVITTKVKALLAEDAFLKSFKIGVKTQKGTVRLSGSVASQDAVDKAVEITRSVKGVKSVKNKLIVKK